MQTNSDVQLASNSLLFFNAMVNSHVEQPLNVQDQIVAILGNVAPQSARAVGILQNQKSWRQFLPPLYNFLITCVEVFLERHFIERYRRPDGRTYSSCEEWLLDIRTFKSSLTWPHKKAQDYIRAPFSFQRLAAVDELYSVALGKRISSYPKYDLIRLMFSKRHLFTHRGGLVDQKFIDEYNDYHKAHGGQLLDASALGKAAFIEKDWMRESIQEVREFVNFVVEEAC